MAGTHITSREEFAIWRECETNHFSTIVVKDGIVIAA